MNETSRVDITTPFTCDIISWKLSNGHVEYELQCERMFTNQKWTVYRRYNDFLQLNNELAPFGMDFMLPPKKTFGNTKPLFVEQRKTGLQDFMDKITVHPLLYCTQPVLEFVTIKENIDTRELMQCAATSFRNHHDFIVIKRFNHNGWRYCKFFYQVIHHQTKELYMYSWLPYGPIKTIAPLMLPVIFDFLKKLKFPLFMSPIKVFADSYGIGVIADFKPTGSLRDQLYKKTPEGIFWHKYSIATEVCSITGDSAKIIAREVLEALIALHTLFIPYTNIHCGNVIVSQNGCQLMDIEHALTGQSSFNYPALVKNKYVKTVEDMMVVNYGQLVYEMITGIMVFPEHCADAALSKLPVFFQSFLRRIFQPDYKLPSLTQLTNDTLFLNVSMPSMKRYYLSMPLAVKKLLEATMNKVGEKLTTDKAAYNERRRHEHFQELVHSDVERQRRKELVLAQLRQTT